MSEHTRETNTALTPIRTLNQRLKTIVESRTRGKPVLVWGLVTDILRTHNGNYNLQLRQGNTSLRCYISRELARELGFYLEDGQTLRVLGEVRVYARWGALELFAQRVELQTPATEDEEWEALKKRANDAGWLDPARKRPIPRPPRTIGLVAGKESDARKDVKRSLKEASVGAEVIFEAAWMGGEEAAQGIRSSLTKLNKKPDLDVIVIARGGGAKPELAAFNDWGLAREIVQSRAPVITAIGHWEDRTLADLVADRSVPTPSWAGRTLAGEPSEPRYANEEAPQERPDWRRCLAAVVLAGGVVVTLAVLAVLARALGLW